MKTHWRLSHVHWIVLCCCFSSYLLVKSQTVNSDRCINRCNEEQGRCELGLTNLCSCFWPFNGNAPDCSERKCPTGNAWTDGATENQIAHKPSQCSNRVRNTQEGYHTHKGLPTHSECTVGQGECNFPSGRCQCDSQFEGDACQRMMCGRSELGEICHGHGKCVSIGDYAQNDDGLGGSYRRFRYDQWDARQTMGCVCDPGYKGHSCESLECPAAPDSIGQRDLEIKHFQTTCINKPDVQRIIIGSEGPDPIALTRQTLTISHLTTAGAFPLGRLRVVVDMSYDRTFDEENPDDTTCAFCPHVGTNRSELATAIGLPYIGSPKDRADELSRAFREAITSITKDDPEIETTPFIDGKERGYNMGPSLRGNVPEVVIQDIDAFVTVTSERNVIGDDIYGWFTLQYSLTDTNQNPVIDSNTVVVTPECDDPEFEHPVNASCLGVNANPDAVKSILESIDELCDPEDRNATGCFDINFLPKEGVGIIWEITFSRGKKGLGTRPLFTVKNDQTRYISRTGSSNNASVTTEKVQDGTYLGGEFTLGITWDGRKTLHRFSPDVNASIMEEMIEKWPLEGFESYAIGDIVVKESTVFEGVDVAGTAEDCGQKQWAITFHSIAEGLDAFDMNSSDLVLSMSNSPVDSSAGMKLLYESRKEETITIATAVSEKDEIQSIRFDNGRRLERSVYNLTLGKQDRSAFVGGRVALVVDLTDCAFCRFRSRKTTENPFWRLSGDQTNNTKRVAASATALKFTVEGLANVGSGQVKVEGFSDETFMTDTFMITFSGRNVPGDLHDALSIDYEKSSINTLGSGFSSLTESAIFESITQLSGEDFIGQANITYDASTPANLPAFGRDRVPFINILLNVTVDAQTIEEALINEGLEDIQVTTRFTSPFDTARADFLDWLITFVPSSGDSTSVGYRAPFTCSPSSNLSCSVKSIQGGSFLSGNFTLVTEFNGLVARSKPIDASSSGQTVQNTFAELFKLDEPGQLLETTVKRKIRRPTTRAKWSGQYEWTFTFPHVRGSSFDFRFTFENNLSGGASLRAGSNNAFPFILHQTQSSLPGEIHEVQVINFLGNSSGDCPAGPFLLRLGSQRTKSSLSLSTSTLHDLEEALLELDRVKNVSLSTLPDSPSSLLCRLDSDVSVEITFANSVGDLPPLEAESSFRNVQDTITVSINSQYGISGFRAKKGTRRALVCGGRGGCVMDTFNVVFCECDEDSAGNVMFANGDNVGTAGNRQEWRGGGAGLVEACNFRNNRGTLNRCPTNDETMVCSGHGKCSSEFGLEDNRYICICDRDYQGHDCSQLGCPSHPALFDKATSRNFAHVPAECGNVGSCQTASGSCTCRLGLIAQSDEGTDCRRLRCPGTDGTCLNGGKCVFMHELARTSLGDKGEPIKGAYRTAWDANFLRGCGCPRPFVYSGRYNQAFVRRIGFRCQEATCPAGGDPVDLATSYPIYNRFTLQCNASEGAFSLNFRGAVSVLVPADAPIRNNLRNKDAEIGAQVTLESALLGMTSIGNVNVEVSDESIPDSDKLTCANGTIEYSIHITIVSPHGDVPLLKIQRNSLNDGSTIRVFKSESSNIIPFECNRRGVCDRETGRCRCQIQFGTSNGNLSFGTLGDCGRLDVLEGWRRVTATEGQDEDDVDVSFDTELFDLGSFDETDL